MVDKIKTQNYFDGATALFGISSALLKAQSSLAADLSGTEGMAGKDERGKEFGDALQASDYDGLYVRQHRKYL